MTGDNERMVERTEDCGCRRKIWPRLRSQVVYPCVTHNIMGLGWTIDHPHESDAEVLSIDARASGDEMAR